MPFSIARTWRTPRLDTVLMQGEVWLPVEERRFATPVRWKDFAEFESRMMRPTYAEHHLDAAKVEAVREAFQKRVQAKGYEFARPMHVRLLRRKSF